MGTLLVGYTSTTLPQGEFVSATSSNAIKTRSGSGTVAVETGTPTTATFMLDGNFHPNGTIFRVMLYKGSDRSLIAYSDWIDDANVTVDAETTVPVTGLTVVNNTESYIVAVEENAETTQGFFPLIRLSDQYTSEVSGSVNYDGSTSGYTQDVTEVPDPLPPYDSSTGGNQEGMYLFFSAPDVIIADAGGDNAGYPGEQITINFTGDIGATQGTGSVTLWDASRTYSQALTVDEWNQGDGSTTGYVLATIPVTGLQGASDHKLDVTTDAGVTTTLDPFTLEAKPSYAFVNVVSPVTDASSIFYQMTGTPVTGDQIEHSDAGNTTVNPDGTFTQTTPNNFEARVWDETDGTWGSFVTIDVSSGVNYGVRKTLRNMETATAESSLSNLNVMVFKTVPANPVFQATNGTTDGLGVFEVSESTINQNSVTGESLGTTDGSGNLSTTVSSAGNSLFDVIDRFSISITIGGETITDDGAGSLTGDASATGTIDYSTGAITISGAAVSTAATIDYTWRQTEVFVAITSSNGNNIAGSWMSVVDMDTANESVIRV